MQGRTGHCHVRPSPLTPAGPELASFPAVRPLPQLQRGESPSWPHSCMGPRPCETHCGQGQGGAGSRPWSAVAAGQVLPVFLALLQQQPRQQQLPAPPGRAGEQRPRFKYTGTLRSCGCAVGLDTERWPRQHLQLLLAQLLAQGDAEAASVQEQPLLKQNNLQKYRYSLCPRPDLAKEEQGSCPGQGLAQPHRAFGHRGSVHPTHRARPVPSPSGSLSSPSSERALLAWAEVPSQHSAQLPQSCPGPGHGGEQGLSPAKGLQGLLPPRSAACVCSRCCRRHGRAALRGAKRGHGRDEPRRRAWRWPWQDAHCSCVPQEM